MRGFIFTKLEEAKLYVADCEDLWACLLSTKQPYPKNTKLLINKLLFSVCHADNTKKSGYFPRLVL
jgi:hypothetical protein